MNDPPCDLLLSQGSLTTTTIFALLVIGAVGLVHPSTAPLVPGEPILERPHWENVNLVQEEPSAPTLGLQGGPMWREFCVGRPIIVP